MQDTLVLRPDLLDTLVALAGAALLQGQSEEACNIIDALRPWRAASVEVRFFDTLLALARDDPYQAARLLHELHGEDCGEKADLVECMLAVVLQAMQDPLWQHHAQHLASHGQQHMAVHLAQGMLGMKEEPCGHSHVPSGRSAASGQRAPGGYLHF